MKKQEIIKKIESEKTRSAWKKGVNTYAIELLEDLENKEINEENLLNGACNWQEYSYSGLSLIYDQDICERLSNNTEKKITKNGRRRPNKKENWLDVQSRALYQACTKILNLKEV